MITRDRREIRYSVCEPRHVHFAGEISCERTSRALPERAPVVQPLVSRRLSLRKSGLAILGSWEEHRARRPL